jgi:hypothetical protein
MLSRLKGYLWVVIGVAVFYFLLSHHFIFYSLKHFDLLNKKELTLKYTFYSLRQHTPYETLRIKALRDAGIENLMIEQGIVSEERLNTILSDIDAAN